MNIQSSFLNSFYSKNHTDPSTINTFLNQYEQEKCGDAEIPKYLQNSNLNNILADLHQRKLFHGKLYDTFSHINLSLDCEEDTVESSNAMVKIDEPDVDSYKSFPQTYNNTFSVLDIFSTSHRSEVQRLKHIFKTTYPLLLINSYKYKMMADFYEAMGIKQDHYRIVYKIIVLTLLTIIDDVEAFSDQTITCAMLNMILEKLRTPPSLEFCKAWMKKHQLSCLIRNTNDNKYVVYNYYESKPDVYILFEFYSKSLVVLKQAVLTQ